MSLSEVRNEIQNRKESKNGNSKSKRSNLIRK